MGVSVKTIRRLEQKAVGLKPGEAPKRNPGSRKRKSYGAKEVAAVKRAWDKNPKGTCMQLLITQDTWLSFKEDCEHHLEGSHREVLSFCQQAFPHCLSTGEETGMGSWSLVLGEVSLEQLLLC